MGRIADMEKLEKEKRKKRKRIILAVIFVIGVIIAIIVNPLLGLVVALTPLVINAMFDAGADIAKGEENLPKKIKEELAPKIIKLALPDSEYLPYNGIEEEQYKLAEYIEPIFEYKSSDKIITPVKIDDNTSFKVEFAEISFKKEAKDKAPFVGIFGKAKLPKDIRSKVKINREGMYGKGNIFKVDMEFKEFEDSFDVLSPNKTLAKKVLTEHLMEEMVALYNTYGYMIEINMIRDMLYIRVASGPMIKDTRDGKIIDRIVMEKHYNMLQPLTKFIEKIYKIVKDIEIQYG